MAASAALARRSPDVMRWAVSDGSEAEGAVREAVKANGGSDGPTAYCL